VGRTYTYIVCWNRLQHSGNAYGKCRRLPCSYRTGTSLPLHCLLLLPLLLLLPSLLPRPTPTSYPGIALDLFQTTNVQRKPLPAGTTSKTHKRTNRTTQILCKDTGDIIEPKCLWYYTGFGGGRGCPSPERRWGEQGEIPMPVPIKPVWYCRVVRVQTSATRRIVVVLDG